MRISTIIAICICVTRFLTPAASAAAALKCSAGPRGKIITVVHKALTVGANMDRVYNFPNIQFDFNHRSGDGAVYVTKHNAGVCTIHADAGYYVSGGRYEVQATNNLDPATVAKIEFTFVVDDGRFEIDQLKPVNGTMNVAMHVTLSRKNVPTPTGH